MPKKEAYPDETLRMAATLYYVDGLGQAEVASLVRVSQTKISRLLAVALERGIVRISVDEYQARNDRLEHQLCSRFSLKSAAVIRTAKNAGAEAARRTVGHFGAPFVASIFPTTGIVAVPKRQQRAAVCVPGLGRADHPAVAALPRVGRAVAQPARQLGIGLQHARPGLSLEVLAGRFATPVQGAPR